MSNDVEWIFCDGYVFLYETIVPCLSKQFELVYIRQYYTSICCSQQKLFFCIIADENGHNDATIYIVYNPRKCHAKTVNGNCEHMGVKILGRLCITTDCMLKSIRLPL